jgi:iron uptake system component EfeO
LTLEGHIHHHPQAGEIEVISSDQRVKGEAENVAPSFAKSFTAAGLTPGTYDLVCGSTKAPKGTLTIVAPGGADPTTAATNVTAGTTPGTELSPGLQDALTQYKAYVHTQALEAQKQTQAFVAAIQSGDLAKAQSMFGTIRQPYENIEPVAESFADIDAAVDARVDDFDSPDDPKFTGYHRLEYGLFEKKSLDGLTPIAAQLQADIDKLVEKTNDLDVTASGMVNGSRELLEEVSAKKITGEEDRYSHTDLFDFRANLDGSQKIFVLVKPMVSDKDPALADKIGKAFDDVDKTLTTYENPDGTYKLYSALTEDDKKSMSAQIAQLSEDLAQLPGVLGLAAPAPASADSTTSTAK